MSGGAWGYQQSVLEELAEKASSGLILLSRIEHEMDWGISGDSCYACAKNRVCAALEVYFSSLNSDASLQEALAVLDNHESNVCYTHGLAAAGGQR